MKELSMHVYDLMENSTAANSTEVKLTIRDSAKDNVYDFTIEDNGKGMTPEFLAKVTDPYTTSRTTRKVGLGLPLIKMNSEHCGGGMTLESTVGVGTKLHFWFQLDHWDRPPMGDLSGTIVMLSAAHEDIRIIYRHITDDGEYVFDTDEIHEALDGMSMNDVSVMNYLKEMVQENLEAINYHD
ncbi:MAG: sensor histidine kinase [Bacteroidales bacterium]|nr:sensor histidine kinase [Bacteroidales bacterium]